MSLNICFYNNALKIIKNKLFWPYYDNQVLLNNIYFYKFHLIVVNFVAETFILSQFAFNCAVLEVVLFLLKF